MVNLCGTSADTADAQCIKCPEGVDSQCPAGWRCYAGYSDCKSDFPAHTGLIAYTVSVQLGAQISHLLGLLGIFVGVLATEVAVRYLACSKVQCCYGNGCNELHPTHRWCYLPAIHQQVRKNFRRLTRDTHATCMRAGFVPVQDVWPGRINRCGTTTFNVELACIKCPGGLDSECPSGSRCFAGYSDCDGAPREYCSTAKYNLKSALIEAVDNWFEY